MDDIQLHYYLLTYSLCSLANQIKECYIWPQGCSLPMPALFCVSLNICFSGRSVSPQTVLLPYAGCLSMSSIFPCLTPAPLTISVCREADCHHLGDRVPIKLQAEVHPEGKLDCLWDLMVCFLAGVHVP